MAGNTVLFRSWLTDGKEKRKARNDSWQKIHACKKMLADCGVASRRKAEEMIQAGWVTVNGETAHIGDKVDPRRDRVAVKGRPVQARGKNVYIMLHKPRGYITTMSDEMGRRCVAELVKDIPERIYPVGRLDRESEGLLLMTNDGEFANKMVHPSCMYLKSTGLPFAPVLRKTSSPR